MGQNKFHWTGVCNFFYTSGTKVSTVFMLNKAHYPQHLFWGHEHWLKCFPLMVRVFWSLPLWRPYMVLLNQVSDLTHPCKIMMRVQLQNNDKGHWDYLYNYIYVLHAMYSNRLFRAPVSCAARNPTAESRGSREPRDPLCVLIVLPRNLKATRQSCCHNACPIAEPLKKI